MKVYLLFKNKSLFQYLIQWPYPRKVDALVHRTKRDSTQSFARWLGLFDYAASNETERALPRFIYWSLLTKNNSFAFKAVIFY